MSYLFVCECVLSVCVCECVCTQINEKRNLFFSGKFITFGSGGWMGFMFKLSRGTCRCVTWYIEGDSLIVKHWQAGLATTDRNRALSTAQFYFDNDNCSLPKYTLFQYSLFSFRFILVRLWPFSIFVILLIFSYVFDDLVLRHDSVSVSFLQLCTWLYKQISLRNLQSTFLIQK